MPQKKRVLFVNYSLHSGGIEKSLVTLLSLFDFERYDVDLQLFANEGLFLDRVPAQVNLLPPLFPAEYKLNIRQALFALLKRGHPLVALCRLMVTFAGKTPGGMGDRLARMWRIERHFVHPAREAYDAAVAFMEGQPIYYVVTKVNARRKLGFIHGDYNAMRLSQDFDRPFVARLDALCTVSEGCKTALEDNFPEFQEKFHVIYNIISARFLRKMAEEPVSFGDGFQGKRVLSIARLSHQKGLDLALPAIAALREKGLRFRWYIIGVGPEEDSLKEQAQSLGIEEDVRFLGEQANPYPFLRACDVYLQPSRFEGKSIAVDEAMVLCKPILLTDFSTAADQVASGETGLIVPMSPEGIEAGLERLLTDEGLCRAFSGALATRDYTNENEIQKVYSLLESE